VTGAELAQVITALATLVASVGAFLVSLRNSRKIEEVHRTTNSLSQRNEQLAKDVGIAIGKKEEKDNPS
jgi:hypothetical protein